MEDYTEGFFTNCMKHSLNIVTQAALKRKGVYLPSPFNNRSYLSRQQEISSAFVMHNNFIGFNAFILTVAFIV